MIFPTKIQYRFCFLDQNTHLPVLDSFLVIKIINTNESALFRDLNTDCLEGEGNEIEFIVKGRYYKPIQIKRIIKRKKRINLDLKFVAKIVKKLVLHLF